jgi:hypothetical protein
VPAVEGATEGRAAAQEGVVLSNLVQAARAAVPVSTSSSAGCLGPAHVVAAGAPGGEGHSLGALAHDNEGKDSQRGRRRRSC